MCIRKLLLCSAIALSSTAAVAADAVVVDEVIATAPEWNWSGAYIGLHGGYGWSDASSEYNDNFFNDNCGPGGFDAWGCAVDLDPEGAFGGVQVGYNYVFGNGFMLGVEGDWSYASLHDSGEGYWDERDQLATIQARFGYAMGRWLPFATLGWGWAHVERTAYNPDFLNPPVTDKNWHDGWTAGVGAEYAIDNNWSVKGEYRYFDAGDEDYSLTFADGTNVDMTIHTLRFGVNYRF
jgi:outer membrane immunogenic protein